MTGATSPEIQEVEEIGVSLSKGAACSEIQSLELSYASWVATSGLGVDSEDDEEVAVRNTLERGLTWACRTIGELILSTTSVSFSH
jgi:hypothetical protein